MPDAPLEPSVPVTVCVATFRRPSGLVRLLRSLAADAGAPVERVVVVDNDPAGSAREALDGERDRLPWPVTYVVEPTPGVSAARNRAIAEALGAGAELVAFVDDDAVVQPGWVDALLRTRARTGAAVVTGAVDFDFDGERPAPWLAPFYSLPEYEDGARLHYAITGNLLLEAPLLRSLDVIFDPRYGRTGGEDVHLFERLRLAGVHMAFAADARVTEMVSSDRIGVGWVLRREHWRGTLQSLVLRDVRPTPAAYAKRVAAAGYHLLTGLVAALMVWRGRHGVLAGVHRMAYGAGLASGLLSGLRGRRPARYGAGD